MEEEKEEPSVEEIEPSGPLKRARPAGGSSSEPSKSSPGLPVPQKIRLSEVPGMYCFYARTRQATALSDKESFHLMFA